VRKKSDLQVWRSDMTSMLGVADFDLSKYAVSEQPQEEKLPLRNCSLDTDAWVEIHIKCKIEGGGPPAPSTPKRGLSSLNNSGLLRMPTIAEKEEESDMKEEIERREKDYVKRLAALEGEIDGLKKTKSELEQKYSMVSQKYTSA
jgi:hypothetical protein